MITLTNVSKRFDDVWAVNNVSLTMQEGNVFGLIGTNGAGKTTLLRMVAGIIKPDGGHIFIDDKPVFNNENAIQNVYFIPDEPFFFRNANGKDMEKYLNTVYKGFDTKVFYDYLDKFDLDKNRKISTFSKGMQKQMAIICGLCANTKYLICDETFDGLDPVMRNLVKKVIYNDVLERGTTTIITSHSLRELEDTCDQLALLHKGGIVFESDIQNLKTSLFKVQTAFATPFNRAMFEVVGIDILSYSQMGSVCTFIVRGDKATVEEKVRCMNPLLLDILPLNLEEVFVYEMEALGYAFKDVLM